MVLIQHEVGICIDMGVGMGMGVWHQESATTRIISLPGYLLIMGRCTFFFFPFPSLPKQGNLRRLSIEITMKKWRWKEGSGWETGSALLVIGDR
jgi:hypothetical protein